MALISESKLPSLEHGAGPSHRDFIQGPRISQRLDGAFIPTRPEQAPDQE